MHPFGLSADRFDVLAKIEQEHFWFVARRELITGILRQNVPCKLPLLLDLGCGPGLNLSCWGEFADQVLGVDQHMTEASQVKRDNLPDSPEIVESDVTALPFESARADIVLLLDVLEHVDDQKTLSEVFRVLRPGGAVMLSVPAHPWLWGARDVGANHLRRYTQRGLRHTIEAAGFEISVERPYQFLLMPFVVLSRLLGKTSSKTRDIEDRPSPLVNRILKWVNRKEVQMSLSFMAMPSGSSYVVFARKPA